MADVTNLWERGLLKNDSLHETIEETRHIHEGGGGGEGTEES